MGFRNKSINLADTIAILGLVAIAIGFIIILLLPEIRISALMAVSLGLLLLIAAFIIDFRRYGDAITSRQGRFSLGTIIITCLFVGIIIFVNAIGSLYYKRFDMSGLSQFTLTPQTLKVLSEVEAPVKAIGFFIPEDPYSIGNYVKSLLNEYGNNCRQFSMQIIDPDEHPDQAKQYGIKEYQSVVFECGDRRRIVSPSRFLIVDEAGNPAGVKAEYSFTSAILEVTGVAQKKVYFLTGHGEAGIDTNYSKAKEGLKQDLYIIDTLDLKKTPEIPDDCAVLIIAAPQTILSEKEILVLYKYISIGGQVMILTDPNSESEIGKVLSVMGFDLGDGTIIDPSSSVAPHQDMPIVPSDRDYFLLPAVYFPGATAIIPQKELPETIQLMPLVYTDKSSWLDKNFNVDEEPVFNPEIEKMESLAIGALISMTPITGSQAKELTRLVVIGDSDFASNTHYDDANNGDLFLNSVGWLAEETSLISIRRNVQPFRRLVVTPLQVNFIKYSCAALFPFLLIITAGVIWWRRR